MPGVRDHKGEQKAGGEGAIGRCGYEHETQGILMVLELFSTLTAMVHTKTYTGDKIA